MKYNKDEGTYAATVYPGPKNNWVFNAASIWWADGLSASARIQISDTLDSSPPGPGSARAANHGQSVESFSRNWLSVPAGQRGRFYLRRGVN